MKNLRNLAVKYGPKAGVVAAVVAPLASFAQSTTTVFDPTSYVAAIAGTVAGILAIGGAVFGVYVALKSTKWGRAAL